MDERDAHPECVVDETREQTQEYDAYWAECVRSDAHECTYPKREMFRIPRPKA